MPGDPGQQLADIGAMPDRVHARLAGVARIQQPSDLVAEVGVIRQLRFDGRSEPGRPRAQVDIQPAGFGEFDVIAQIVRQLGQGRADPAPPQLAQPGGQGQGVIQGMHGITQLGAVSAQALEIGLEFRVHLAPSVACSYHPPSAAPWRAPQAKRPARPASDRLWLRLQAPSISAVSTRREEPAVRIGIIIGSIREGRRGAALADWVLAQASARADADYVLIDLKEFDVPLLTSATVPGAARKQYDDARVQAWSAAIDACDAFIFVTPEYNHSVPGALKNAFDSLGNEWADKPVAFVSYGADNGVRAVEHWRQIVANFRMFGVRQQLSVSAFLEFGDSGFEPNERRAGELATVLDQLVAVTAKLTA